MAVAAKRLKGQFCENSKMLSYSSDLPELNHNEIVGWENNPHILNNICVLWILDSDDNEYIDKALRNEYSRKLMSRLDLSENLMDTNKI